MNRKDGRWLFAWTMVAFTVAAIGGSQVGCSSSTEKETVASGSDAIQAPIDVLTRGYDKGGTYANTAEGILTPTTVGHPRFGFGKRFVVPVDAQVYAQVLYASGVSTSLGVRNVIYVATMNDSIYAIDADSGAIITFMNYTASGTHPPTLSELGALSGSDFSCLNYNSTIGIASTPVINKTKTTMYFVTLAIENGVAVHRLRMIDIGTLKERNGSGVAIRAPGFVSMIQNQRAGLALDDSAFNAVYVAFGSYCDQGPYHGWLMSYNASAPLAQNAWFNTTPTGTQGGIWQSGGAPVISSSGDVYLTSGNGTADGVKNFGDSVLRFKGSSLQLLAFYTAPIDHTGDLDLGILGPVLFHSQPLVQSGKQGIVYNFLQLTAPLSTQQAPFAATAGNGPEDGFVNLIVFDDGSSLGPALFGWGDGGNDFVRRYRYHSNTGTFDTSYEATAAVPIAAADGPVMTLSSSGKTNAILWATYATSDPGQKTVPGVLQAFDAQTLGPVWSSSNLAADAFGSYAKYNPPIVANGKLFVPSFSNPTGVGGAASVSVYGLKQSNDINGDGLSDVVLTGGLVPPDNTAPWGSIPVALSDGHGSFNIKNAAIRAGDPPFATFATQTPSQAVSGDFNGDGKTDLALAGGSGWGSIPVAKSLGDGTFAVTNSANAAFASLASQAGAKLVAGDFRNIGISDLALVGGSGWNFVAIAYSNGDGSFQPPIKITSFSGDPNFPIFATQQGAKPVVGDFNGDGRDDIALTGGSSAPGVPWGSIPVAFTNSDATAFNVTNYAVSNFPTWATQTGAKPVAGDFDGDGFSDIAMTGGFSSPGVAWKGIPVAFSDGIGHFLAFNAPFTQGGSIATLATNPGAKPVSGDFNNDRRADIALTGGSSSGIPWDSIPVAFSQLTHGGGAFAAVDNPIGGAIPFGTFATQKGAKPVDVVGQ